MDIEIARIAKLACLRIEEDKVSEYQRDLEAMIDMVNHLPEEADLFLPDAAEYMQLRADTAVADKFTREDLLMNAPAVRSGCVAVPKTVGECADETL